MNKQDLIKEELEALAEANDGILKPKDVVDFARNPDTALHNRFEWDNNKAAESYRLWQARQVIKFVFETIEPPDKADFITISSFVSLKEDRENGGGYRLMLDVMTDDDRRKQFLAQAHGEFKRWQYKYQQLKELEPVFRQMADVMAEVVEVV